MTFLRVVILRLTLFIAVSPFKVFSQKFEIRDISSVKELIVRPTQQGLLAFYRIHSSAGSEFRRIVIDENFRLNESSIYDFDQEYRLASHLPFSDKELYVFVSRSSLQFLCVDLEGEKISNFSRSITDLEDILQRPLSRIDNLELELAENSYSSTEAIVYLRAN